MDRGLGVLVCVAVAVFLALQLAGPGKAGRETAPAAGDPSPGPSPDRAGPGYLPADAPTSMPAAPPARPGVRRTSFNELSGYDYDPEADVIPDEVLAMDGRAVDLVGVMYYGVEDPARVSEFHMMPNHFVCCFGTPRTNEVVKVTLREGAATTYLLNYYLVRGTLEVGAARDAKGRVLHLYWIRDAEVEVLH